MQSQLPACSLLQLSDASLQLPESVTPLPLQLTGMQADAFTPLAFKFVTSRIIHRLFMHCFLFRYVCVALGFYLAVLLVPLVEIVWGTRAVFASAVRTQPRPLALLEAACRDAYVAAGCCVMYYPTLGGTKGMAGVRFHYTGAACTPLHWCCC